MSFEDAWQYVICSHSISPTRHGPVWSYISTHYAYSLYSLRCYFSGLKLRLFLRDQGLVYKGNYFRLYFLWRTYKALKSKLCRLHP